MYHYTFDPLKNLKLKVERGVNFEKEAMTSKFKDISLDTEEQALEAAFGGLGAYPDAVKTERMTLYRVAARNYLKKAKQPREARKMPFPSPDAGEENSQGCLA